MRETFIMAKKSYRERVRELREQEILATAARLIHDQGYSNLSMDGLSEEVGISKSTLYQHFSSKEEMIVAVLLKSFRNMEAHMDAAEGAAIDQLQDLLRYIMTEGLEPDGFNTMMVREEVMMLFHTHEAIRDDLSKTHQRIAQLIQQAKAAGTIDAALPDGVVISAMFGMTSVMSAPVVQAPKPQAEDTTDNHHALIDHAIRIWRRGIRPD